MILLKTEYINLIKDNIPELSIGCSYTYQEICFMLGIPYKATNSNFKKSVLDQIGKLITIKKDKTKYEVIDNPFMKEESNPLVRNVPEKTNTSNKDTNNIDNCEKNNLDNIEDDLNIISNEFFMSVKQNLIPSNSYSYKELCALTGSEYKTGNSKQKFIKKLERCVEMVKMGHKYMILDVYDIPLPPQGRKLRKDAVYTKYIEYILLTYLHEYCNGSLEIHPQALWWYLLGMTNFKYMTYRYDKDRYNDLIQQADRNNHVILDKNTIEYFYYKTGIKFSKIFNNALNSLSKRSLLKFNDVYIAIKKGSNDKIILSSSDDIQKMLELETRARLACDIPTTDSIVYNEEMRMKYFRILERLITENTSWKNVYKNIAIIPNKKEYLQMGIDNNETYLKNQIVEFNNVIKNYMIKSSEDAYKKFRDKNSDAIAILDMFGEATEFKKDEIGYIDSKKMDIFTPDYIGKIMFLNDELINVEGIQFGEKEDSLTAGNKFDYDNLYDYIIFDKELHLS